MWNFVLRNSLVSHVSQGRNIERQKKKKDGSDWEDALNRTIQVCAAQYRTTALS